MADKESKKDAGYHGTYEPQPHCKDCTHFCDPSACEIVEGWISPRGWCKHYEGPNQDG